MSDDEIANAEAEGSGDEPDAQSSKLKNKKKETTTKKGNVKPVNVSVHWLCFLRNWNLK